MKKVLFASMSVIFFNCIYAQQNESVEIGGTLLTLNSLASRHYQNEKPLVEYPNGILFRYNRNGFAVRALASYSQYKFSNIDFSFNTYRTGLESKDMRFGFGIQYSLTRKVKWVYTFTDILYRHVSSTGFTATGNPNSVYTYNTESNGGDAFLGFGSSIKIYRFFYLVQEIGLNLRYEQITYSSPNVTAVPLGYWTANLNPIYRLSLVYRLPKNVF